MPPSGAAAVRGRAARGALFPGASEWPALRGALAYGLGKQPCCDSPSARTGAADPAPQRRSVIDGVAASARRAAE
jgi:hypothetical protein